MVNYIEYLKTKFEPVTEDLFRKIRESGEVNMLSAISKLFAAAEDHHILTTSREARDYLIILFAEDRIKIEKSEGQYKISVV